MTHHPIKVLEDGTRVYKAGQRYKPMADEDRTNRVNRPDDPRAVRFYGNWFLPLALLADEERSLPPTRADEEILGHPAHCGCEVCQRPAARRLWRRANKLRS